MIKNNTTVIFTEKVKEKLNKIHIELSNEQIHTLRRIKI